MKAVASISENGWLLESNKILDSVVSYYILSDGGQSLVFKGNVINLPYTYYLYLNETTLMANGIKADLDKLLSRYFPLVETQVEVKLLYDNKYGILLYVSVVDEDSVKIELNKVVEINTSGLRKVTEVNTYGNASSLLNSLT